jgi:hypothetical protein
MNRLFNQRVISAQPVQRDMSSSGSSSSGGIVIPGAKHSGTLVTLQDGSTRLIHHGAGYAKDGHNPTVITDAKNMSNKWTKVGEPYDPKSNVGRMMGDGKPYDAIKNNCHHKTAGMPNASVKISPNSVIPLKIEPKK